MLAVLKSLPELLALIVSLLKLIKTAMGQDPEQFVSDAHKATEQLKNAKTAEEKKDAARAISKLIGRL